MHANLRNLKLDALDVVNLRVGGGSDGHSPVPGSVAEPFGALAELRAQGLIRHLGLSTVDADQVAEAQAIAPVVCVQNFYNVARREDDALVELTARQGIAYVPYSRSGWSPRCSQAPSRPSRPGSAPLRRPSRSRGCFSGHPTCWSSRARHRSRTCGRTWRARRLSLDAATVAELDAIGA